MQSFSSIQTALNPRQWWTIGIVSIALLLLTVFSAPNSPQSVGSTYSRAPEGYGAWYAYMEKNSAKMERLRKPSKEVFQSNSTNSSLIQVLVNGDEGGFFNDDKTSNWISKGNQLILVGTKYIPNGTSIITPANFSSRPISQNNGSITIETSKRFNRLSNSMNGEMTLSPVLKDQHGSLVLEGKMGKGSVIYVLPQFLAANAYQDSNNFAYLKSLITGDRIIVDEYIHGYRDTKPDQSEAKEDVFEFLLKTPIALGILQVCILLAILIYGKNWRFGAIQSVNPPAINNSRAYIQALAGILQKANSTDFVTETLSKAELAKLQRALGLGSSPQNPEQLIKLWSEQTGQSKQTLEPILRSLRRQQKLSEAELSQWLALLQTLSTKV